MLGGRSSTTAAPKTRRTGALQTWTPQMALRPATCLALQDAIGRRTSAQRWMFWNSKPSLRADPQDTARAGRTPSPRNRTRKMRRLGRCAKDRCQQVDQATAPLSRGQECIASRAPGPRPDRAQPRFDPRAFGPGPAPTLGGQKRIIPLVWNICRSSSMVSLATKKTEPDLGHAFVAVLTANWPEYINERPYHCGHFGRRNLA